MVLHNLKAREKVLHGAVWLQVFIIAILHSAVIQAQLPEIEVDGIDVNDNDIFGTMKAIVYLAAEFAIYIIALIAVVIAVLIIIKEARDAKQNDDGRWGRVITAFVGGVIMIVGVMFLLNYALDIIPTS